MTDFFEELSRVAGTDCVVRDEPMKHHTTFRVGGPAGYFVSPSDEEALRAVILLCKERQVPYCVLGNGSNMLVSDDGYEGVIIYMGSGFSYSQAEKERLTVGSGMLLSAAAGQALAHGLTGFEFAAGIPGTMGGATVMNAGAYGGEMKDIVTMVRVMTMDGGIKELGAEEMDFGYRHSCITGNHYIVLSAKLNLKYGDKEAIRSCMDDLAARRREKQPLEYPSAGSTFKRPAGFFAGKLIQDAGLRGYRFGGAQISEKHCGFVINKDHATAEDIRTLISNVQNKVKETSGAFLETEVKMIGWK